MTESIPAKHTRNSILAWAWRLLVLGLLVRVATRGTEWNLVWDRIRELSFAHGIGFALLYTGVHLGRTLRFPILLRRVRFRDVWDLSAQHTLYLRILPFRSGEFAYAALLRNAGYDTAGTGIAHLAITRILDVIVVSALCLLGLVLHSDLFTRAGCSPVPYRCSLLSRQLSCFCRGFFLDSYGSLKRSPQQAFWALSVE